jgi:hypothetical protein
MLLIGEKSSKEATGIIPNFPTKLSAKSICYINTRGNVDNIQYNNQAGKSKGSIQ